MNPRLLLIAIGAETDIVLVRKRTRRLAELIGFDAQDQTRITTAVSEIARNAFEYAGGGQVEFGWSPARRRRHSSSASATRDRGSPICRRSSPDRTSRPPAWALACWARNG